MKILFLHGWHSVPGGVKPTYLISQGHDVSNPPLNDDHFDVALATAQAAFDQNQPDVVVGSSRGGAIAMNLRVGTTPLVLLCPAWKRWGTSVKVPSRTIILHSPDDDVVPFADSEELSLASLDPPAVLFEVGHDHRLADPEPLAVMDWACRLLCAGTELPESTPSLRNGTTSVSEGSYLCDACGEEIVIPLDVSEGSHQTYTEDCPVCCHPNTIHVELGAHGAWTVWSEPEQDRE